MEVIREYWPVIAVALAAALILVFLLRRPRQRIRLTEGSPVRPHMAYAKPPQGRGLAGEAAAATSDVAGELIGAPVHNRLHGAAAVSDDLCLLKGVGPKLAEALHALGFDRFDQLARLTPTELERLDEQLGAFRGRLARDRIVEQADYLARGDIDSFEQRFGKL